MEGVCGKHTLTKKKKVIWFYFVISHKFLKLQIWKLNWKFSKWLNSAQNIFKEKINLSIEFPNRKGIFALFNS